MESRVIVLVLGYKSKNDLKECLESILSQGYTNYEVWFADNASYDGSVDFVSKKFPVVKTIQLKKNTGYAGGNNKLLKKAFASGADFCLLLNPDTKSSSTLIFDLVSTYKNQEEKVEKVGLVQPVVMLYDQPNKINSIGNVIHYLGFGYCGGYLSEKVPKKDEEIISVSGTAMFVSKKYYQDVGKFNEDFFMYNEDQDYSWRGLIMGYKHFLSSSGKIWHKYSFSKNKNKWYHSEKNRLMMVVDNYQARTLLKLIPVIIFDEILILLYSCFDGWFVEKIRSYIFLIKNRNKIFDRYKKINRKRVLDDGQLIKYFASDLNFSVINNLLFRYIINPILTFYRHLLFDT